MAKSVNDVLKHQPVRTFLEKSTLVTALNELDPFQNAAPCFQPRDIAMEPLLLYCPTCERVTVTVPAEGVPNQSLRGCLTCEDVFIKDWMVIVPGESA